MGLGDVQGCLHDFVETVIGHVARYQKLRRRHVIQLQRLDPGHVHAHFTVHSRAQDADDHAEIGRQPCRICINGLMEWIRINRLGLMTGNFSFIATHCRLVTIQIQIHFNFSNQTGQSNAMEWKWRKLGTIHKRLLKCDQINQNELNWIEYNA